MSKLIKISKNNLGLILVCSLIGLILAGVFISCNESSPTEPTIQKSETQDDSAVKKGEVEEEEAAEAQKSEEKKAVTSAEEESVTAEGKKAVKGAVKADETVVDRESKSPAVERAKELSERVSIPAAVERAEKESETISRQGEKAKKVEDEKPVSTREDRSKGVKDRKSVPTVTERSRGTEEGTKASRESGTPGGVLSPEDNSLLKIGNQSTENLPFNMPIESLPGDCNSPSTEPVYATADVDGNTGEWILANDFFACMYEAGNPSFTVLSKLYLRYDCNTNTVYALVLAEDGFTPLQQPQDAWIKIYDIQQDPLVDGYSGDDGTPPDFQWVYANGNLLGYEASFSLNEGTYNELEAHIQIEGDVGGRTSSTGKGEYRIPLVIDCPECQIECPDNVDGAECDQTDPTYTGTPTLIGECSGITYDYDDQVAMGDCNPYYYTITRTWTAYDGSSIVDQCIQTITVVDNTPPTLDGCPDDATYQCYGDVPAPATVTATDICDDDVPVVFNETESNPGSSCNNTITRTWTATDDCGNTATCTQTITVNDNTAPVLSGCPADITIECDESVPAPATVTATDNCDPNPIVTYDGETITPGACPQEYTITRSWTATDACGNSASCTQTITVEDNTAPELIGCPADVTVECDAVPAPAEVTATDNCDPNPTVTFTETRIEGACAQEYTLIRTWTATDACGNFASCTQTINVIDTTPPVITCPANVTVECDAATDPSATGEATATDNCDASPTISFTDVEAPGSCPQEKTITRTWTATDACGNFSTCTQTINIVDTTPPSITCPADATVECDESTAPANTGSATATDNCDASPTISFTDVVTPGSCPQEKTITRTWTATDACGNSASCTQTIEVVDTTPPTVSCPSNVTVYLEPGDVCPPVVNFSATAVDNCSETVTVTCDPPSGSTFPVGETTVTCTATDECGNVGQCTFTVTVYSSICAVKFYDANLNGVNDDGQIVEGWEFTLSGASIGTATTGSDGKACFTGLLPGDYTVTEMPPEGWVATTSTFQSVYGLECPPVDALEFGNVCLGEGGGHTPGFWRNKNGQALITLDDLQALRNLNLKNEDGSAFDPTTKEEFAEWLKNANATNMSYMLSVHLAAMTLNVRHGFVDGDAIVYAPNCGNTGVGNNFISINDLMADADAALAANSGNQECLKDALDYANNNENFVQPEPCEL
jgi:hypothetical protein